MCAPGGPRWEQSCDECHDPCNRERWGCDAEAEQYVHTMACTVCGGGLPSCGFCHGTGQIEFRRCPNALVTARELDVVRAVAMVEHGVLPDDGGWMQQAGTFVQAYPLVAMQIGHWREEAIERERKNAKKRRR